MDVQRGVVERYADRGVLDRLVAAVEAARTSGVPVIFVRVAFRPGFPEVSRSNRRFTAIAESGAGLGVDDPATQLHPALAARPDEPVVLKKRISAFTGSDLEVLLRAREVSRLVLCGIATSGVVLSTVREAADRDFELTVLADACTDADDEVHRVLVEKVLPRQADVTTVEQWQRSVAAGG
jgi:nicotinamidase-related amidase